MSGKSSSWNPLFDTEVPTDIRGRNRADVNSTGVMQSASVLQGAMKGRLQRKKHKPAMFTYLEYHPHQRCRHTSAEDYTPKEYKDEGAERRQFSDADTSWGIPISTDPLIVKPLTPSYDPVQFTHSSILQREGMPRGEAAATLTDPN